MIQSCSPLDNFLSFLKQETGKKVKPVDALFHRDFARYRHLPYQAPEGDTCEVGFMQRAWIDVILREGLSDEIRSILFPKRFDLGSADFGNDQSAKLTDLIAELNSGLSDLKGEKLSGVTKKDLRPTLDGIKDTVGFDLSDSQLDYPVSSLKVIKLLHRMREKRASSLFGKIKPPRRGESTRVGPTAEFMDAAPDMLNTDEALIFSDLVSYLSIEIPEEKLGYIQKNILTYHELPWRIACENIKITEPIRTYHDDDSDQIAATYQEVAKRVEEYQPVSLTMSPAPLDETLYTYLRTLPFQHFVGAYEVILKDSIIDTPLNDVTDEIKDFCNSLSKELKIPISPGTETVSIKDIYVFIWRYEAKFRGLVESATGLYVRRDGLDEIVSHVEKILSIHIWRLRGIKDLNAVVISVADCIAALCAVRHQQSVNTPYAHYIHGEKPAGKGTLKSFAKAKSVEVLQDTDYIPQSASQLMLLRFGRVHSYITGHGDKRADAWSQFQLARLKKYVQMFQSYDVEAIAFTVRRFNQYCEGVVENLTSSSPAT